VRAFDVDRAHQKSQFLEKPSKTLQENSRAGGIDVTPFARLNACHH
jgi:hypothetical protein